MPRLVLILLLITPAIIVVCTQPVRAIVTIHIQVDGSIYPGTAPIQRNNDIYTLTSNIASDYDGIVIERNNTILDGAGFALQGTLPPSSRGVYMEMLNNVTIRNMKITGFEFAVYFFDCTESQMLESEIFGNTYGLILDSYSSGNAVFDNEVSDNQYSVNCWGYSDYNTIAGNNISTSSLAGVWIVGSSNNSVIENRIAGGSQYGISLEGSSNNSIYHNSFVDNAIQVYTYDAMDIWNVAYPSGGNHWSDYGGVDTNGDGIGDAAYAIDENNQDQYPVMNLWTNIAIDSLFLPKNVTAKGSVLQINVTVRNHGFEIATFNVTAHANTTQIQTVLVPLAGRDFTTITLAWNTSDFARAYNLIVNASRAQGETDLSDNNKVYSVVKVSCIGDINGDYATDAKDFVLVKKAIPSVPGNPKWNPNADMNNDLVIDGKDYQIVKIHIPTILP